MDESGSGHHLFSVLLVCYGNYPQYSTRAIDSLARTPRLTESCEVYIGCNAVGADTAKLVRECVDSGIVSGAIESPRNRHKQPMVRTMLDMVVTPFILVMDDDSHVKEHWAEAIAEFIRDEDPVDVAGAMYFWPRTEEYQRAVERRPWWRGMQYVPESQRKQIEFCTGGFLLARTAFLRQHNYPDVGMVIQYDDAMLADLVYQVGGKLRALPDSVLSRVVINDGQRRWKWEDGANDGGVEPEGRRISDCRFQISDFKFQISEKSPPAAPVSPFQIRAEARTTNHEAALRAAVDCLRGGRYRDAEVACQKVLAAQADHAVRCICWASSFTTPAGAARRRG